MAGDASLRQTWGVTPAFPARVRRIAREWGPQVAVLLVVFLGMRAWQLRGAAEWHINADEQDAQGYADGDASVPFRSSDHDPLLLGKGTLASPSA